MATFYLEVTSGGDVLAVDANTALAYQTGSVEDGGTLVTITPTLEAVGFDLPSDIDIFYKDSTSSTWLPSNAAGRTFEVSLADGSYTYEAQLRYDADTPVTDENGAEVAIQTTAFTVGAAAPATPDDTYTDSSVVWSSSNSFWVGLNQGSWDSTGSSTGTYLQLTSACRIRVTGISFINVSATADDFVDVSIGGGQTRRATYDGSSVDESGNPLFAWDEATTSTDIEPGGTFGWVDSSALDISYYIG